jgi:hypothetical protein
MRFHLVKTKDFFFFQNGRFPAFQEDKHAGEDDEHQHSRSEERTLRSSSRLENNIKRLQ